MTDKESMDTYKALKSLEYKTGDAKINIASLIPDNVQEEMKLQVLVNLNNYTLEQLENLQWLAKRVYKTEG